MQASDFTAFDIGILVIVGLSTIFAFARGFATVALSFAAWAGALLATVFGFSLAQPYGRDLISPPELADIATLAIIFFVSLFVLKAFADWFGTKIKESPVGLLDRSLGALFGLLRGMVIVGVLYLGFIKIFPGEDGPDWVQNARLKPLVAWGAEMLEGFAASALGQDPTDVGTEYLQRAADSIPSQFSVEELEKLAPEYDPAMRSELEALIKKKTDEDDGN
ncbi:CvpA family protein [Eilatimonas milleporae]|uniref:Putative membrane protein required for colicin V production n=1 Tax=Eilatimonas milleporae TaxID=911205 RepID=A0A3M0CHR2_9PROT|nr:CvpA family protein [Eilatimonas milleporae]RMB08862.1 putative membrane protein required for colicin V production [Eilatimonas milleporae]